jgi:RimJ/RimL family protein N-acetyltransferase
MIAPELVTELPGLRLIAPDVVRDAPNGVEWLRGAIGRETLGLMGVNDAENVESDLATETDRITHMIESEDELAWMLERDGKVIGVLEVRLKGDEYLRAPNINTMIGDPSARGQGVGTAAKRAVIDYMFHEYGAGELYSRHLTRNEISAAGLAKLGFQNDGDAYTDADGLEWQNMALRRGSYGKA